jgi:hypothetical protein
MSNCGGSSSKSILRLIAAFTLFASFSHAQTDPIALQAGSINTATADPLLPRPATQPCVVSLFTMVEFGDFTPKTFSYTPPACPGPWAKVVLRSNFSVTAGRQFDRTANIWIGGTNVYFGTTSEPSGATNGECLPAASNFSRCWHVERDLTDYSALFTVPQPGRVDLGNLVNSTFTGVLFGSADLQFYPLAKSSSDDSSSEHQSRDEDHPHAPRAADFVLPLSASATGGTVALQTGTSELSVTSVLPTNIERAFLDVIAQSQAADEFWYTCVPDQDAANLQSCGGTAFRETEVSIDGQPAGVAPVYPWIYTGGIDPFLWRPVPGVQTLNFVPYRVDLTPFAGVLNDGSAHKVAVRVFNANHNFATTATLLLYLDHRSSRVGGQVTKNTLAASPVPNIVENLSAAASDGTITGTVTTTAARQFTIAGEVKTSHGRVRTEVTQRIDFSNAQQFVSNPNNGNLLQDITQNTTIMSVTETRSGEGHALSVVGQQWPLVVDINFVANADGSFTQATDIQHEFHRDDLVKQDGRPTFFSTLSNVVKPSDTLFFSPSFAVTGNTGQVSSQQYFSKDSTGACFSRSISAANGVLTSIIDGKGCEPESARDNQPIANER